MKFGQIVVVFVWSFFIQSTLAKSALTPEPDGGSYQFVSHHRISIDAPVPTVWMHLPSVGGWTSGEEGLNQTGNSTLVDMTLSRRYEWPIEGKNPMRERRMSAEFNTNTDATWNQFLDQVRQLSETAGEDA